MKRGTTPEKALEKYRRSSAKKLHKKSKSSLRIEIEDVLRKYSLLDNFPSLM